MSEFYTPPGNEPQEPTLAEVGQQLLENDALQYTRLRQRLLDQHVVSHHPDSESSSMSLPTSPYNFAFVSAVALKSVGYQVTLSSPPDLFTKNLTLSCAPDDFDTVDTVLAFGYLPTDVFEESSFIESICSGAHLASVLDHGAVSFPYKHIMSGKTEEEKDASVKRAFITALAIWQDIKDSDVFTYGNEERHDELATELNYQKYATIRKEGYTPYNIEHLYGMVEGNVRRRITALGEDGQPPANPPEPKVYR
jgi:hypothetical protein